MYRRGSIRLLSCAFVLLIQDVNCYMSENFTVDPAGRQLLDFKLRHPKPIGYATLSSGVPFELRESVGINSDILSSNAHLDHILSMTQERIPERVVHAKASGGLGFFEVMNDVSEYTCADVFNGVGKKTPVVVRLSTSVQNMGGTDLSREMRGLTVKFYTKDGNLDILAINYPVYFYNDPMDFTMFVHAMKRNPKTNLYDNSARMDFLTLRPSTLHAFLWLLSDYGIPNGYRRMEAFPNHAFLLNNKRGGKHIVRFSFRPELGFDFLTTAQAQEISGRDPDYFTRDLYNAIEEKNYPTWNLEMDVLSTNNITELDYDPFDVTRLWKKGTYHTVRIGRLVLDRNLDNQFENIEQAAFNPANLVPGIPGPLDLMFKSRRLAYRDSQNYRLGVNHNKIYVNRPGYAKTYLRDGTPPVNDNMKDAPNFYPNSFNGPEPVLDIRRPNEKYTVYQSNSVDLEPSSYFYNHVLTNDSQRQRLVDNLVSTLQTVAPESLVERVLKLMNMVDDDLGKKTTEGLAKARALSNASPDSSKNLKTGRGTSN